MRKIIEAEILATRYKRIRITLSDGQVVEGVTLGILPMVDEEGEELDYDILAFEADKPAEVYYSLRDEDILKVERAT